MIRFRLAVDEDVSLELMAPSQAETVYRAIDRDRNHLRSWLPWVDGTQHPSDTRAHIELWARAHARNEGFSLGIFHRQAFAGVIGFHGFDSINNITSIGYWLSSDFTGLGLMTRSTARLLDYAVFDRGMNRIYIRCGTGNAKSRAIPERLGFVHEGTQREAEWLYDRYTDLEVYSILAREWLGLRNRWMDRVP